MTITDIVRRSSWIMPINRHRLAENARHLLGHANAMAAKEARKIDDLHLARVA